MYIQILFLCILLIVLPNPSRAQFVGIGIRIPNASQDGVGNGVIIGGGGGGIPSGAIQDDSSHYLQDDASHYLIAG